MDIFNVLTMIGGLALFLYGMKAMGDGLAKMAGGKLEQILEKLTSKRIFAVLLGTGVTAIIQSSSATTVMVVGFVNSGIMKLGQAVGIIMGANIGTTVTSWLLSLTGIQGSNVFVKLLKPSSFSPVLAAVGIILVMVAGKDDKKKNIGDIMLGFAILMFGMETMSSAVSPLSQNEQFTSILTAFSFPILGMLAGAILTAIIQSSSASVGILQALCLTGAVSYATAIPIIMGQNIGTCITSILSSIGANRNAKRASMIHLYFNLLGTIIFMIVFYSANAFVHFSFLGTSASVTGIAVIHTTFNVVATIMFYPFADKLVALATLTIPEKPEENEKSDIATELDERFLETPAFAMEVCRNLTNRMAEEVKNAISLALELLDKYDSAKAEQVIELEQRVDEYEDALGSYLVKLSGRNLSHKDSQTMSIVLHSISDFERISDHAINIQECAFDINEKKMEFSDSAKNELHVMIKAVRDIVDKTIDIFEKEDIESAVTVEPLEEIIDRINKEIKTRHIKRLRNGECTIELGIELEDILTILERISDHCSNIALAIIEISDDEFDTHAYVERLNKGQGSQFLEEIKKLEKVYKLPA